MAVNLNSKESPPAVFYANPLRMALSVLRHFGVGAMLGFVRLMAFCKYPASLMDRFTPRSVPPTLEELLARAPNARRRKQIELAFTGSAMDLVDRFLPDRKRHRTLRALVPSPRCSRRTRGRSRRAARCVSCTPSRRTRAAD